MSFDTDAPLRIASDALIGQDAARSLCIALIKDFQTAQVRAGRMAREALITDVLARMDPAEQAALAISEDTLAIDSLASMDLIVPINRYFGLATTGIEDHLFMRKTLGDWAELVAHHFELMGADAQITFSTSGSSGPAKHITHGQAVLRAEVQAISDSIFRDVAPPRRVLSAVPPHHIYGFLWSVLMPGHLGAQRLQLHDHAPTATVKRGQAGDVILFTPFLLEKAAAFDLSLKPDVTVVSSGGPMRAETWESAKRLGAARCVEVYGSTETGGIGWRSDPAQPLKLLPHLERMGDGVKARAKDTPLPLQDVIAWENDTSFCVIGRGDRVVQVGGTNVDLGLVERTLQQSGHVREAVVRLDGLRLKAFVVPEGEEDAALDGAVRQALAVLPAIARPQELSFGPEIPRTSTGKPSDW